MGSRAGSSPWSEELGGFTVAQPSPPVSDSISIVPKGSANPGAVTPARPPRQPPSPFCPQLTGVTPARWGRAGSSHRCVSSPVRIIACTHPCRSVSVPQPLYDQLALGCMHRHVPSTRSCVEGAGSRALRLLGMTLLRTWCPFSRSRTRRGIAGPHGNSTCHGLGDRRLQRGRPMDIPSQVGGLQSVHPLPTLAATFTLKQGAVPVSLTAFETTTGVCLVTVGCSSPRLAPGRCRPLARGCVRVHRSAPREARRIPGEGAGMTHRPATQLSALSMGCLLSTGTGGGGWGWQGRGGRRVEEGQAPHRPPTLRAALLVSSLCGHHCTEHLSV